MEKGTKSDTNLTRARLGIEACRRNSSQRAQSCCQLAETTAVYEKETEKMCRQCQICAKLPREGPHVSRI
jgi:hypothetical protein